MKKTIVLFLLAMSTIPLFVFSGRSVKADGINSLSYAKGNNLLDTTNLQYVGGTLKTINNIYLEDAGENLYISLPHVDGYYGQTNVAFDYYDIDNVRLSCSQSMLIDDLDEETEGGTAYYTFIFHSTSDAAFSFSLSVNEVDPDTVNEVKNGISITKTDHLIPHEDYVKSNGLFDLSEAEVPLLTVAYPRTLTEAQIKGLLVATDGYDGNITENMTIDASSYLLSASKLGIYQVNCSVSDSSGNAQTGSFFIKVVDIEAPAITGPDIFRFPVFTDLTDSIILASYHASDVHDGDLTNSIQISGTYTANSNTIKTEPITIKVADASGNETSKNITISFYDNVAPVITISPMIEISYQVTKTISAIMNDSLTATDNLDSNPIVSIKSDGYTGNERKLGTYTVVFEAKDSFGNKSTASTSIHVYDDIKPVIYLNSSCVETLSSVVLSVEDLTKLLEASGEISKGKKYQAVVIKDTYSLHANEPGNYVIIVRYLSDGNSFTKSFEIKVTESSYTIDTEAKANPSLSIFEIIAISVASFLALVLLVIATICLIKKRKIRRR